jgi:hypothetical protein
VAEPEDGEPLVNAIAGTLSIIGALMERADIATIDDFASALGVYLTVTREAAPKEAAIISKWVLALREAAAASHDPN